MRIYYCPLIKAEKAFIHSAKGEMKAFLIGKQVKINACIEKHLAEQYQLNSGKYAEKLKHIADKNFQTNCNKNDAAENIRLVGKPGSEAFSKGKSGHADKECDYGNDQGTDKSH